MKLFLLVTKFPTADADSFNVDDKWELANFTDYRFPTADADSFNVDMQVNRQDGARIISFRPLTRIHLMSTEGRHGYHFRELAVSDR